MVTRRSAALDAALEYERERARWRLTPFMMCQSTTLGSMMVTVSLFLGSSYSIEIGRHLDQCMRRSVAAASALLEIGEMQADTAVALVELSSDSATLSLISVESGRELIEYASIGAAFESSSLETMLCPA